MTVEGQIIPRKPLGLVCEMTPREIRYRRLLNQWVHGNATFNEVLAACPSSDGDWGCDELQPRVIKGLRLLIL